MYKAKSLPDDPSSYPFRSTVKINAVVNTWYKDPSLDAVAEAFGSKVRDLWRSTAGLASNSTYVLFLFLQLPLLPWLGGLYGADALCRYINFAFGDENLSTVYGNNVARLQALKKEYDPKGRFDQFFPLSN